MASRHTNKKYGNGHYCRKQQPGSKSHSITPSSVQATSELTFVSEKQSCFPKSHSKYRDFGEYVWTMSYFDSVVLDVSHPAYALNLAAHIRLMSACTADVVDSDLLHIYTRSRELLFALFYTLSLLSNFLRPPGSKIRARPDLGGYANFIDVYQLNHEVRLNSHQRPSTEMSASSPIGSIVYNSPIKR